MNKLEQQPTLETERLRLRPLKLSDAPAVQEYVSDARVAEMTSQIPHPYPELGAEEWIRGHGSGEETVFARARKKDDEMIGAIGIRPESHGLAAEIGFWVGIPYWGHGFCTEAAREILRYCFEELGIQRVWAGHIAGNEASGRVQQKIGIKHEGYSPWAIFRFGEPKDRVLFGIIRPDWEEMNRPG